MLRLGGLLWHRDVNSCGKEILWHESIWHRDRDIVV